MCGISGFAGGCHPGLIRQMIAVQSHRGPDGRGVFENAEQEIGLGHVRLAILDLSDQAAQPMRSRDGRYTLTYNGEIYNFAELRRNLIADGYSFSSSGDTEVLLQGLAHEGEAFLRRLNGIFAFALWDSEERHLLLARDPLGVKPLYYAEPERGTLLFASEIKALCAHPKLKREVDIDVLHEHLIFCHATGERTAIKGVRRLMPGTLLRWDASSRQSRTERYWTPSYEGKAARNWTDTCASLRASMESATIRQLVSDVPVGIALSGGVDSSLIAALATKAGQPVRCFTIAYPRVKSRMDCWVDDAPHARRVARQLGLPLEEMLISASAASLLPSLVHYLDEPIVDPAIISSYLISKMARDQGVRVLLSGQGADELFCGYPRYQAMQATKWLRQLPGWARRTIGRAASVLPGAWGGRFGIAMRRVRRTLAASGKSEDERFLTYCSHATEDDIRRILSAQLREQLPDAYSHTGCLEYMRVRGLKGVARLQDRDLSVYLPNHNLLYTDKMSMAVGVETRVPFLDLDLVNYAMHRQETRELRMGQTKSLLRSAARGIVPDEVLERAKTGFGAPFRQWLRHDLHEMWEDLTTESVVRKRGWFDHTAIQDIRRRCETGRADLYLLQWAVLTLELWARQFIDSNPAERADSHSDSPPVPHRPGTSFAWAA